MICEKMVKSIVIGVKGFWDRGDVLQCQFSEFGNTLSRILFELMQLGKLVQCLSFHFLL